MGPIKRFQDGHLKVNIFQKKFTNDTKADIYIVAVARNDPKNYTVVTMEKSNNNGKSCIKLPDVCTHYGIKSIKLLDMIRELGLKY